MSCGLISFFGYAAATWCFSPVYTSAMGVSPNYQTKANEYTIIPAINEINSVILTKSFAGISLLLHIYCISIEASIPTIQDRINTIIPDLFVAYAIAKEHNAITTTEVIILFFFIYATSIACKKSPPIKIIPSNDRKIYYASHIFITIY